MPHFRVLISDNCKDYAKMLSDCLLTNADIEIVGIAKDGVETIKMLQSTKPDVLLLDMIMPNLDGLEVLRQIKNKDDSPMILVISAVGTKEIINQAITLGADYYFVKPCDLASVASKIREIKLLCN